MKKIFLLGLAITLFFSCETEKDDVQETIEVIAADPISEEYGYILNDFDVVRDTIRTGDTFGDILDSNGVSADKIFTAAKKFKDSFDVRRIVVGRPYVLLNNKTAPNNTEVFIYETNRSDYAVVDLRNDMSCYNKSKPVSFEERSASGVITSSLSQTMQDNNLSPAMTDKLSRIFAWTVNFFKLQEGDSFKVVYTEKYINDTIPAGVNEIKAAYFEHNGKPLYSFNYEFDSINHKSDFYDENADNLKRAFLKAPVAYSRISSRYNLNRRIAYYGYKVRPHKGTDFAAAIGTPILATANGVISKSEYRGGNGNYVKIRHNSTYETQYLHMKKRNVRVGQQVTQGDVIGWVGVTGNSGGPHVCYRFWKNGKQVDPFKQDLPMSTPLEKQLQEGYFAYIAPLRKQLDGIQYN